MSAYRDSSLATYLDDLAAKLPAPGGGSAAALNAGMAAALVSMVLNFTIGKPKYEAYATELRSLYEKSEKLRQEFLNLVDLDVVAYQSKDTRKALDVPFMLSRLCVEGMRLCPPLVKKGNPHLASDVAVAAIFFESAFSAACVNVEINLKGLGDKKLARLLRGEMSRNRKVMLLTRAKMEEKIGDLIRG